MTFVIVGLGNPGEEYKDTRHNIGRMVLSKLAKDNGFEDFSYDKILFSLKTKGELDGEKVTLLLPETYMNRSGFSMSKAIKSKSALKDLIVVHDDVDLPVGVVKISFARGSGGHKGIDSISKSLKTNEYTRIRMGIAPETPGGKIKKPGKTKMNNFVTSKFTPNEEKGIKKATKLACEAIREIVLNGRDSAANIYNSI